MIDFSNVTDITLPNNQEVIALDINNVRVWEKTSPTPEPQHSEAFYIEDISGSNNTLSITNYQGGPRVTVYKSTDGITWSSIGTTTSGSSITASIPANGKLYLRCNTDSWAYSDYQHNYINCSGFFNIGGNIMSLIYGTDFTGSETTLPVGARYSFASLFNVRSGSSKLVSARKLVLPLAKLENYCYTAMFYNCSLLSSVTCLANEISNTSSINAWLFNVAKNGNFYKPASTANNFGIPSTWSVNDYNEPSVPFYVEDASGSVNTLSIKKESSTAPTLTIEKSNDGTTWTSMGNTSTTAISVTVPANSKIYLRCSTTAWGGSGFGEYNVISCSGSFNVGGNIMSLLYGSSFTGDESSFPSGSTYSFSGLFYYSGKIVSASNLLLPATTLVSGCYYRMFRMSSIVTPPELPSTTLADRCYYEMFSSAYSLTKAPVLPARSLVTNSYFSLFTSSSNVNYIICLATDISASYCTYYWITASTGSFITPSSTAWTTGSNGIPSGWTRVNA